MDNSIFASLGIGFIIVWLAFVILMIASVWRIFEKAGQPGWACIIPIYNLLVELKIIHKPWWWLLLLFIPLLNIVFAIWMTNLLSKSFGKDEGFTVGLILLPFVFYPILGFGSATYQWGDRKEGQPNVLDAGAIG